jgi:hypothetical protein
VASHSCNLSGGFLATEVAAALSAYGTKTRVSMVYPEHFALQDSLPVYVSYTECLLLLLVPYLFSTCSVVPIGIRIQISVYC